MFARFFVKSIELCQLLQLLTEFSEVFLLALG